MQFIDWVARCDRVVDCHDFSDEIGCLTQDEECPYRCRDSDICLLDAYQCDGWFDCPNRDDEDNCEIAKCPDGYVCGEAPFNDNNGPVNFCERFVWQPFWVNATRPWKRDDIKNTAKKAVILYMNGIPTTLEEGSFKGLHNVNNLNLASCELSYLTPGVFDGLDRLYILELGDNRLTIIEEGLFRNLFYLGVITLEANHAIQFEEGCFQGLPRLFAIDLTNNSLTKFSPGTFKDLGVSFQRLILKWNQLTSLDETLFYGIGHELLRVNLGDNLIEYIAPGTFQNLSKLTDLVITSLSPKSIPLYTGIFDGLDSLSALYVYDSRFCCLTPDTVNCIEERPPHPLFTCRKTFLQNHTIKVFIWILGISALVGNSFVLVLRLKSTPTTRVARIQSMIITNLALSDLLMGVYMVLLAVMDVYIGESYFWEGRAEEWRASITCQIAGFISVLSSETSVFLLILLTIDRFICVVFPFSKMHLGIASTRIAIAIIWVASIFLSVIGVLLHNISPDAYSLSDVCVGLPFIRKSTDLRTEVDTRTTDQYGIPYFTTIAGSTESTWTYSIIIFLGINLCSFIIILLLYIGIFIKVRFVRAEVGRTNQSSNEVKMALKMLLIVGTDFCCWMPIIIIGILVQTVGVEVTPDIYAWLVVFVLPINSSLNPYLYTIINLVSK
ncbi:G-protein coupled receptor GRL101-like [Lytechinus variegatus]|uniref:G-protein coupled receptor GRL101-like n=1 Tax=Lytechinus variegatus TaxID=7654 RepID=UPI001BB15EFE|nr:G-protein coupled receptor GRL101-like [Lytechinus variegatus]